MDTSVILRRSKHAMYEYESFPVHWDNFDRLINEGKIISPPSVNEEILFNSQELKDWCDENDKMFISPDNNMVGELCFLSEEYPDWYKANKDSRKDGADPWLIAYAKVYDVVLVTQEKWNLNATEEHNYKIPTICFKLGAYCHIGKNISKNIGLDVPFQCIDFFEMIKREKLFQENST
jgi:hypothetical protein